jgi:hypothetical protein
MGNYSFFMLACSGRIYSLIRRWIQWVVQQIRVWHPFRGMSSFSRWACKIHHTICHAILQSGYHTSCLILTNTRQAVDAGDGISGGREDGVWSEEDEDNKRDDMNSKVDLNNDQFVRVLEVKWKDGSWQWARRMCTYPCGLPQLSMVRNVWTSPTI